jgi:hypothetical protein
MLDEKKTSMRFDNTITLGNILTAITMALAGAAAWTNMSERITLTEQAQKVLREAYARHEAELRTIKADNREVLLEIKADIKELRNDMRRK